jgi:hypothetical protein
MMPPKKIRDPLGPAVRGNDARAANAMLNVRNNEANDVVIEAKTVHWEAGGARSESAPSIAVDRGSTILRRESAERIHSSKRESSFSIMSTDSDISSILGFSTLLTFLKGKQHNDHQKANCTPIQCNV